MTVEYIDGFDLYGTSGTASIAGRWVQQGDAGVVAGRNSGRAIQLSSHYDGMDYFRQALTRSMSAAAVNLNVGFAINTSSYSGYESAFFSLRHASGGLISLGIDYNGNLGYVALSDAKDLSTYNSLSMTQLSSSSFPTGTWVFVELLFSISGSNLTVTAKLDGVAAGSTVLNVGSGRTITAYSLIGDGNFSNNFDDLYVRVASSFVNAGHTMAVGLLTPNASGSVAQFSNNAHTVVNNVPENLSSHASTGTVGQKQTWGLSDVPAHIKGSVQAIQTHLRVRNAGTSTPVVQPIVRVGSTDYDAGATVSLSSAVAQTVVRVLANNPATSAPWSVAAINGMEAGCELDSAS